MDNIHKLNIMTMPVKKKTSTKKSAVKKSTAKKPTGKKYGKAAAKWVERAMHKKKKGTLKSGSGRKVKSTKQAIAIGLSEAREKGAKVPKKKTTKK
jgi:hypothetical protein